MQIQSFFDDQTFTICHIIIDEDSKKCAIIDSILDYDIFSGRISTKFADNLIAFINQNNLTLEWILETHIHADHITAAHYLHQKLGGKIAIGSGIFAVLKYWVKAFNIADDVSADGLQFDHIFKDEEEFKIGNLKAKFIATPGHTPACGSYLIEDAAFIGDLMFMPSFGTGRADFPGGDAREQFNSLQKIFALPDDVKIFTGHDYPKAGQKPQWQSNVKEQKENNIFAKIKDEEEYVKARKERDKNLPVPKLLLPAIQMNLRCGELPSKERNGVSYLKIPLNLI